MSNTILAIVKYLVNLVKKHKKKSIFAILLAGVYILWKKRNSHIDLLIKKATARMMKELQNSMEKQ